MVFFPVYIKPGKVNVTWERLELLNGTHTNEGRIDDVPNMGGGSFRSMVPGTSCYFLSILFVITGPEKLKRCLNPDLNRVSRMSRILEGRNIWTCQRVYIYTHICSFASIQIHIPFTYLYILYIYVYIFTYKYTVSPSFPVFFSVWEICESLSFWGLPVCHFLTLRQTADAFCKEVEQSLEVWHEPDVEEKALEICDFQG